VSGASEPLAALRERLRGATPSELPSLLVELASDRRRGARALAARGQRGLARIARERERLTRLFALRDRLRAQGAQRIAGVDEVGVGPLAGPVVAAAVVLRPDAWLAGVDDSKKLSAPARARLDVAIRGAAEGVGIGVVEADEIDSLGIYRAALEAMRRAVVALPEPPDHLLVDARSVPGVAMRQTPIVHGDALDGSIAAASIVAKVARDATMQLFDASYPGYGFARHMGYGTEAHLAALARLGPCAIHRRSFAPVAASLR
jgi:ribonuclease HII